MQLFSLRSFLWTLAGLVIIAAGLLISSINWCFPFPLTAHDEMKNLSLYLAYRQEFSLEDAFGGSDTLVENERNGSSFRISKVYDGQEVVGLYIVNEIDGQYQVMLNCHRQFVDTVIINLGPR